MRGRKSERLGEEGDRKFPRSIAKPCESSAVFKDAVMARVAGLSALVEVISLPRRVTVSLTEYLIWSIDVFLPLLSGFLKIFRAF